MDEHPDIPGEHVGVGHRDVCHGGPRHPIHRIHRQLVIRPILLPGAAPAAGNTQQPVSLRTENRRLSHCLSFLFVTQGFAIYVSSLSLLGIAWDRYTSLHLTYARTSRAAEPSAILMVVIIDLTSIVMMMPYCWNMKYSVYEVEFPNFDIDTLGSCHIMY